MPVLHLRSAQPVVVDAAGRPREVMIGHVPVAVSDIESVREEVAAYPPATGPRTLFVARAGGARVLLVHQHRQRSWSVEVIRSGPTRLGAAA